VVHPSSRGLAFLLSLGGLPVACFDDRGPAGGTTGAGPGTTTGGDPAELPACESYYDLLLACSPGKGPEYANYWETYCENFIATGLQMDGEACALAIVGGFTCLSQLICDALFMPGSCEDVWKAADAACPTIFPEGTTDGEAGDEGDDAGSTADPTSGTTGPTAG
jgi:hypothetical protein